MTDEQWDLDMAVNLRGAYRVVRACLPGMRERGYGRIVVVSSGAARGGLPGQVAYSASKAGLGGMVRTIAAENAARGITANAVLPGMVATEVVLGMPEEIRERVLAALPARRFVELEELAAVVAFLASPASGSVTGEELGVDGGLHLNTMSLAGPPEVRLRDPESAATVVVRPRELAGLRDTLSRLPELLRSSSTAFVTKRNGNESAIGDALTMLPPMVPTCRICGAPNRETIL